MDSTQKSNYTLEETQKKTKEAKKEPIKKRRVLTVETDDESVLRPSQVLALNNKSELKFRKKKSVSSKNAGKGIVQELEKTKGSSAEDVIQIFVLPNQPEYKEKEKLPEKWSLLQIAEMLVLFYLLMDTYEIHKVIPYAQEGGGYIFLAAYFILSFLFELIILNLFIHIGQYSKAGITKLFGMYTTIAKGIGWSLLVITILHCASTVNYTATRFATIYHVGLKPYKLVDCKEYPQYDCSNPEVFHSTTMCCTSIYNAVACMSNENKTISNEYVTTLGSKCVESLPTSLWRRIAIRIFQKELPTSTAQLWAGFGTVTLISFGLAGLSFAGYKVYTFAMAVAGFLATALLLPKLIGSLFLGDVGAGSRLLSIASLPDQFFSVNTMQNLSALLILPMMKFGVISFGSFRSNKYDSFYTVLPLTIARRVFSLFVVLSNIAMIGFFMNYPNQQHGHNHLEMIPEFLLSSGFSPVIYYVSFCGMILMEFSRVAGLIYITLGITRDHLQDVASYWKYVSSFGIILIISLINVIFTYHQSKQIAVTIFSFMPTAGLFWIFLIGFSTVFLYGIFEHLLDRAPGIPSNNKWTNTIGAASPYYPSWIANKFPVFLIAIFSLDVTHKFTKLKESDQMLSFSLGLMVILLPVFVLILCTIHFLHRVEDSRYSGFRKWWRLFYPSEEHPSYKRIIGKDIILKDN